MPCGPECRDAPDRGFTLVEVMAATAVLGVLVLCLANAWAVFDRISFGLLLRQKAVFVLNGEMERLALLYGTTGFGAGTLPQATGYAALPNVPNSATRLAYGTNSTAAGFATNSVSGLASADSTVWVYGSGAAARNFVWLDRGRNLLAQVSWVPCAVSASTVQTCWGAGGKAPSSSKGQANPYVCFAFSGSSDGGTCLLVTLALDYPFQLAGGTPVLMANQATTLTLSTIVGRRR